MRPSLITADEGTTLILKTTEMNNSHVGLALKSAVSIYIHIEMGIAIALQLQKSSLLYGC